MCRCIGQPGQQQRQSQPSENDQRDDRQHNENQATGVTRSELEFQRHQAGKLIPRLDSLLKKFLPIAQFGFDARARARRGFLRVFWVSRCP